MDAGPHVARGSLGVGLWHLTGVCMKLEEVREKALALGFVDCGIAPVEPLPGERERLEEWLRLGKHAGMGYMARNVEKRENPALLVAGARSVLVTLTNYYTGVHQPEGVPRISRYAYGRDYHEVLKQRLHQLWRDLEETAGRAIHGRVFVDSAPVFEREWARRAGLGWIGRHSLLIHPRWGSYCFIGVIISDFEPDTYSLPFEGNRCGTCVRCLAACPTRALIPCVVDANRCISYNTIERKDAIPPRLKSLMAGYLFGCDICQDVCPWNRKAVPHCDAAFQADTELLSMTREDWLALDETTFRERFAHSPLLRPGLSRLQELLR